MNKHSCLLDANTLVLIYNRNDIAVENQRAQSGQYRSILSRSLNFAILENPLPSPYGPVDNGLSLGEIMRIEKVHT